ncbi:MAG: acyl-CoA dehydrogenase [Desulfobacterium sp.]|jgi:butyryl-CoA dehydrogenase|nr:acyl-CoA dehydrogenase [Desulfobacterium sp.]
MGTRFISERNLDFLLYEMFDVEALTRSKPYDQHSKKVFTMVVHAAAKLASSELYPILDEMDKNGPTLVDGRVAVHPRVRSLMAAYGEGGWIGSSFPEEHDGEGLPAIISSTCRFIFAAANYSASVFPELTAGAAELILTFGSEDLIKTYLPPMLAGKWQGTMALTEPQAGSSLSDITTTAFPTDEGYYSIKGQKTFISAGDHDGVDNVVHLMLARIEGEPPGSKGISLFVVPKFRPDEGGKLSPNDVTVAAVYHKLGYRGAPITELSIGEKNDCRGFLVGEKNRGLACMFQMMNEARLGVGLGATAIATAAYYAALDYAMDRPQGRRLSEKNPAVPQVPIIEHADVKRMLLFQRAIVEGSLSLCLQCCLYSDLAKISEGEAKERNLLLLDLLTPIAKSYPSEMGILSTSQAIQCFGGYGYCEDFPVEQYFRDSRIHPIHEGTTGMQGMDLLGRKMVMNNGRAGLLFVEEVSRAIADAVAEHGTYAELLSRALERQKEVTAHLFSLAGKKGPETFLADATLFLEMTGILAIAWQWLVQATKAHKALEGKCRPRDVAFYQGKLLTFRYFFRYELPRTLGLGKRLMDNDFITMETTTKHFND